MTDNPLGAAQLEYINSVPYDEHKSAVEIIGRLEAENKRLIDYLAGGNGDEGGPDVCPVCEEVLDFDGERETGHADGCKLADAQAEGPNA